MATYTFDKIEYGGNTYVVSDSGALQLTGGQVTGPVTFGDSVSIDEATLGDLVVNGSASFTNNIQANTINGVTVGSSPKFTDTNTEVSTLTLVAGSTAGTSLTSGGKFTLTAGSKTVSFTMPTIPTVPSNIVNTITTTAGAHTAITSQKGNVSFNVPTTAAHVGAATSDHTHGNITNGGDITATAPTIASGDQIIINDHSASKITNGPTFDGSTTTTALTPKGTWESFAKSDTNTTYALSGALSSHKFTSTLTAGGSGSGTSTSDFTLAAGTGITITDDTSARKMTIACSVTNTDTKLTVAAITSGTQYYPVVADGANTGKERQVDTTGFTYKGTNGTTSTVGSSILALGNATGSGTANNKQAQLVMYGSNTKKATITLAAPSADIALALPTSGGTIALTSQIPTVPSSTGSATTGITASTTATKTTLGTASSIYGVGSTTTTASKASGANGSASTWAFEEVSIPNVTAAGSASTWAFTGVTVANSISGAVDANDSTQLNITVGTTTVQSKSSGSNGSAPTLGAAIKVQSKKSGANGTAPSWSFTDVDVPIKNGTATSVPSVSVASATVSITDNGHTHTI